MPKALDLTPDLIDLGRAARAAELAMAAAAQPGADIDTERARYVSAAMAIYAHPLLEQARTEGCHAQTLQAVKDAIRAEAG